MSGQSVGLALAGEVHGTAVIRDKDGNVKSSFTFGGPATSEQAAQISGKSEEHVRNNLGKNLLGDNNGSDTDHSGA